MAKLTIDVTQDDILCGRPGLKCHCAISRALSRTLGGKWAVYDDGECEDWDDTTRTLVLPKRARRFISDFDRGVYRRPFSFEVEL